MAKKVRFPVTKIALTARINRQLAKSDEQMKAVRGGPAKEALGDYVVISLKRNAVVSDNIDPEELARELGVLEAWEYYSEGGK